MNARQLFPVLAVCVLALALAGLAESGRVQRAAPADATERPSDDGGTPAAPAAPAESDALGDAAPPPSAPDPEPATRQEVAA